MTKKEAGKYAEKMTYHEAIYNLKQAKSIPYRKATFIKIYELLDKLEQEHIWIPVTEELPKEHLYKDGYIEPSDYVLVWGDRGSYGVSRYWGNRRSKAKSPNTYKDWMDLDWVVQKPIAWMPLPQPYKAESEEV